MKRFTFFLLLSIPALMMLQAQQLSPVYIVEMGDSYPESFRDDNGNVHMYFAVHGMTTQTSREEFINGLYGFGGVEEVEVTDAGTLATTFHVVLYSDAGINFVKKMFYMQNMTQYLFYGESYTMDELTNEIITNHIEL